MIFLWLPVSTLPEGICIFSGSSLFRNSSSFVSGIIANLVVTTVLWKTTSMAAALLHRYIHGIVLVKNVIDIYEKITPWAQLIICFSINIYALVSLNNKKYP
jgi:hypothetical protein